MRDKPHRSPVSSYPTNPETLADFVHLVEREMGDVLMPAGTMRAGTTLHPVWIRTAVVSEISSTFSGKMQVMLQQAARSASMLFDEQIAKVFVAFLTPASVVALVLGLWRFSADIGWTEAFLITSGFFSHWQVWIALAIALQGVASWGNANRPNRPKTSEEN
jgi:hypothetical protein